VTGVDFRFYGDMDLINKTVLTDICILYYFNNVCT
jgi:hypothetical protein